MLIEISKEFDEWSKMPKLKNCIVRAAEAAIASQDESYTKEAELSILLTSDQAVRKLNLTYRGFDKPTNVLSFPGEIATNAENRSALLGDIVLSYQTIAAEAEQQHKSFEDHVSHLIVHGVLHLLGHDHLDDVSAQDMELLEVNILQGIGVDNPYENSQ